MNPIIPWMGGKRRLLDDIHPLIPKHQCYVEAFAGGAALYFRKPPSEVEVINDFNGELVRLYRVVRHHLEEFVRQFKWALSSRQIFEWEKMTRPETLTDIQRAARFYYLQKLAFGGKCDGQSFGTATTSPPRLNLLRIEEELSAAHLRLSRTYIENLSWDDCVTRYDRPHSFHYLDPPYWQTAGYGVDFGWEQFELMADMAKSIDGMMLISINDHPDIRKVFDGLNMIQLDITYTVGGGDNQSEAKELLIWNDNLEKSPKSPTQQPLFNDY